VCVCVCLCVCVQVCACMCVCVRANCMHACVCVCVCVCASVLIALCVCVRARACERACGSGCVHKNAYIKLPVGLESSATAGRPTQCGTSRSAKATSSKHRRVRLALPSPHEEVGLERPRTARHRGVRWVSSAPARRETAVPAGAGWAQAFVRGLLPTSAGTLGAMTPQALISGHVRRFPAPAAVTDTQQGAIHTRSGAGTACSALRD